MKTSAKWLLGIGAGVGVLALLTRDKDDGAAAPFDYDRMLRSLEMGDMGVREAVGREAQRRGDTWGQLWYVATTPQPSESDWDAFRALVERAASEGLPYEQMFPLVLEWDAGIRRASSMPDGQPWMPAVGALHLWGNQISDLTPLAGLTGLQRLDLGHNPISDLTPLAGLTGLQRLYLWGNQISDLTPLAGLTGLQRLDLGRNQISDLTPLAGLTGLQQLYLGRNQISDVTPLAGLTRLQTLWLSYNQISNEQVQWLRQQLPNTTVNS